MNKYSLVRKYYIASILAALSIVGCSDDSTPSNNIQTTKEFVADARTWSTVISNETQTAGSELDLRATAAGQIFDSIGPVLGTAMGVAFDAAVKAYASGADIELSDFNTLPGAISPVTATGTANVSGNTVTVSGSVTSLTGITNNASGVPSTPVEETAVVNLVLLFPASLNATSFTIDVQSGTASNADAVMDISTGTATLNYGQSIDITPWVDGTNTVDPFPSFDSAGMDFTVAISETRSDPISFSGTLSADLIGAKENGVVKRDPVTNEVVHYNPDNMLLSGRFGTGGSFFSAEFSATVPNAETFFPLEPAFVAGNTYDIGTYVFSNSDNTVTIDIPGKNYVMTFNNSVPASPVVDITYTYTYPGATPTSYSVSANSLLEFLASSAKDLMNDTYLWVDLQGNYSANVPVTWDTVNGGVITGTLIYADYQPEEDATNFLQIQNLNMTFIAQLAGLPQAKFVINANRTDFLGGDFTVTAAYGSRSIAYSVTFDNDVAIAISITVTNTEGDTLLITFDDVTGTGTVTFNGEDQATLEKDALGVVVITYSDGTFESFM